MNRAFVFEDEGSEPFVLPPKSQSPWEFAGYSETVANEHARRNTTSIDHKISQLRSRFYKPHEHEEKDVDEDEDEEENEEGGGKPLRNAFAMAREDGKDVKVMKTGHCEGENDDDDDDDEESSDIESLDDKPSIPSRTPAKIHKCRIYLAQLTSEEIKGRAFVLSTGSERDTLGCKTTLDSLQCADS